MIELTTNTVSASEALDYWRSVAFRRMEVEPSADNHRPFQAQLRRLACGNGEFWDHFSDRIRVVRSDRRCKADGGDELYIGMVLDGPSVIDQNRNHHQLRPGSLYIADFGRPVQADWSRHRELAVVIRRDYAAAVLGEPLDMLGGRLLPPNGMTSLLASHLCQLASEASHLVEEERAVATQAAIDMALSAVRSATKGRYAPEAPESAGLLAAARFAIARQYADPNLSPEKLAAAVDCSRTQLYRIFAKQGEGVSAAIWAVRLARARDMLTATTHRRLSIEEIAFRCGFLDPSNFARMFKRRYGVTPRHMREADTISD
jgi:AraC-like DNA-binding protein